MRKTSAPSLILRTRWFRQETVYTTKDLVGEVVLRDAGKQQAHFSFFPVWDVA